MTHWLTGLWSTQAKVEGNLLTAACHWGGDSSVISNHLGKPGHKPRPPVCVEFHGRCPNVFPCFMGQLFNWGLLRDMTE